MKVYTFSVKNHLICGFTLVEILISLFILSLLVLSYGAVQTIVDKQNLAATELTIATYQIISLQERISANQSLTGLDVQIQRWQQQNKKLLPHAVSQISGDYPDYIVSLCWGSAENSRCLTGDPER